MNNIIESRISAFGAINLSELNSKAEMLARIDNKYIMPGHLLAQAIESFGDLFDVLDIDGQRSFAYSTIYFDDAERRGYYDHHQRKRKRLKARVRSYVEANLHYLEVKLNDRRSTTLKKRLRVATPLSELDGNCLNFIDSCNREVYGVPFRKQIGGVIRIAYNRLTLVAKDGGERMTIDCRMSFTGNSRVCAPPSDTFIVETKSARGNGVADKIFRALHVQPTKRVSKYCIGLAATGQVLRHNGFLPALRRLELDQAAQNHLPEITYQPPFLPQHALALESYNLLAAE